MVKSLVVLSLLAAVPAFSGELLFQDPFQKSLKPGWSWIREDSSAWRLRDGALEIRIQPGNMWGPENSGKNVLIRSLPSSATGDLILTMIVENRPSGQYEQTDLVCYFDDSHMVKLGQELVDGKLSIVMGREEADKTRTIAIIPLATARVELRLRVRAGTVTGQFRPGATGEWQTAGTCDLPKQGPWKAAVQCYQGLHDQEHWSRIENFRVERASE